MLRRVLGLVMILVALAGVAVSLGGILLIRQIPDDTPAFLERQLGVVEDSLGMVSDTVGTTTHGLNTVADSLVSLQETTLQWTDAVSNTAPALEAANVLVTEDLPETLRALEDSLPALQQTAGVVDQSLVQVAQLQSLLNNLGLVSTPPVFYDPEVLLSEAIGQIGDSLEGVPERLESMAPSLDTAQQQLVVVEDTIVAINAANEAITRDIEQLAENVGGFETVATELEGVPGALRSDLGRVIRGAKAAAVIVLAWLGLSQIVPLFVGLQTLFYGRLE